MSNAPVVFLGPTMPSAEARDILRAEFLAPVQLGDVWRVAQERPAAIGIVDGYFDRIPAVRHKEILYALSRGIPVFGASSMGALRAAELAPFGMIAVGQIASAYLSQALAGDDEVALMHGPAELGYCAFSEPLVNIRATLAAAYAAAVVSQRSAATICDAARALNYPDRIWDRILKEAPVPAEEIGRLRAWLPIGRVDQKRADAVDMLERMRGHLEQSGDAPRPSHDFTRTVIWEETTRQETPTAAILEEFLLADPLAPAVRAAVARAQVGEPIDWLNVLMAEPDWPDRCRRARLKSQTCGAAVDKGAWSAEPDEDDLLAWFFGERFKWPSHLDSFLRNRGWTDPSLVLTVAAREAAFLGRSSGA